MNDTDRVEPLAAWEISLRTVTALLRIFGRRMESEMEIPLPWFDVIVQLVESPGGKSRMRDLAQLVVLSPSGLTRLVDRIERAGLVRREASREDRREMAVVLTEQGRQLAQRARVAHHRHVEEVFAHPLDGGDVQAVFEAFSKIRAALTDERADPLSKQR